MNANACNIELRAIDSIRPYPGNPRVNDGAVDAVAASLKEFGFRQPIVVDADGVIIVGHTRWKAAKKLGLTNVPVHVATDLSPEKVRAYRIADNQTATLAEWDFELLPVELRELQGAEYDLGILGFDEGELAKILDGDVKEGLVDPDDAPEPPEAAVTQPGDIWMLGVHRLVCGDSTKAEDVARLMAGETSDMVFTDPPYNVNYANSAKDKLRGKDRPILNDDIGEEFHDFLLAALELIVANCRGAIYVAMSSSELDTLQSAFRAAGGHWSTFIIWAKSAFTIGRADYQRQYEPILYGWPEKRGRHWCGARDQGDVWQIKKPQRNDLHPTMKPVELVVRAIQNSSLPGNVVLDPFAGSGTTCIAAEQTGRRALMMELDPRYCDVIVQRWEAFTGGKAERIPGVGTTTGGGQ